jgi:hypothetical protein
MTTPQPEDVYDELHPIRNYDPLVGLWQHPAMQRLAAMQRQELSEVNHRHTLEVINLSATIKRREELTPELHG